MSGNGRVSDTMLDWACHVITLDGIERDLHIAEKITALGRTVDDPRQEVTNALEAACRKSKVTLPSSAFPCLPRRGDVIRAEAPPATVPPTATTAFIDWPAFWSRGHDDADWEVRDVLARGRGHAIYAPHKCKKSLLMLAFCAKLATGPEPVAVIYLDYEMTEADIRDRLEDMGHGPHTDLTRLHYALLPCLPPLDTPDGASALMQLVDGVQAERLEHRLVVVIDTIGRAVAGEENKADTIRAFYAHTGLELKRRSITWVRLDHAGKDVSRGQRGTSSKGDDVDIVWRLAPTQHGVCLTREAARMSWVPERVTFKMSEDPLRFVRVDADYPDGTGEVANMLDRLDVPLTASSRTAADALRSIGEGRRQQLVVAALRFRRERLEEPRNHPRNHPASCPREPSRCDAGTTHLSRREPPREPPGTTSAVTSGTGFPLYGGTGPGTTANAEDVWRIEVDEEATI